MKDDYEKIIRVARKNHQCSECKKDILEGDKYQDNRGIVMRHSFKLCLDCAGCSESDDQSTSIALF